MKFHVLAIAEAEANEATAWHDDQRPGLGTRFMDEIVRAYDRIRADPDSWPRVEGYVGRHDIRQYLLRRFSYLIVYECIDDEVLVVAVSHTSRRPFYWIDRLP